MKKNIQILLFSAAAIAAAAWYYRGAFNSDVSAPKVCFAQKCYGVEVASTPEARDTGLMFRKQLDRDRGMLFVFDRDGSYHFWMKNTLIPLDIIWIGSDRRIAYISKNTPPCNSDPCPQYGPSSPARYVLEINAGQTDAVGARIGDEITIGR
ncbi:MAG: DUF192 domain-containing protein [Candidatus Pacebacteria bacterium]|nr:DUF192 domain-containing protein [Candidatus Paceibacterota bacterium]